MSAQSARHVDHVGSLLRPESVRAAWFGHEEGKVSAQELERITDQAVREAVKFQEDLGLQYVTDGEFRRGGWSRGFLAAVEGFEMRPSYLTFRSDDGLTTAAPAPVATQKMRRLRPIVANDYVFLAGVTKRTGKVTMPTPPHMHFGLFGECFDHKAYPNVDAWWDDLIQIYRAEIAELYRAGCRFLQLDEVPLTLCCDDDNRGVAKKHGEDPDKLVDVYVRQINRILEGRPADLHVALHLCRGNMQGMWMGNGGYAPIADRLFNALNVDAYLLEYDSPRAGDFAPLQYLPKGKIAFLGLVSTKKPEVESAELLRRRLDEAAKHAPMERLGLCPQCGFASSAMSKFNKLPNPMTPELQKAKLARLVEVAQAVW